MRNDKKVFCLILFMLFALFVFRSFGSEKLTSDNKDDIIFAEIEELVEDVNNIEEKNEKEDKTIKKDIYALREEYGNNDIVAVLRIPNTNYEAIIPQGENNSFYLRKDLNRKYDINGVPFLDYRVNLDNSKKILIYGHNSSKIDMPFKILEKYYNEKFYRNHQYIELETEKEIKRYHIFSVYVETKDFTYYNKIKFENDASYLQHINNLKEKSFYNTGAEVNENDHILILQTCSTLKKYKNEKKKFMLVIAKEEKV